MTARNGLSGKYKHGLFKVEQAINAAFCLEQSRIIREEQVKAQTDI